MSIDKPDDVFRPDIWILCCRGGGGILRRAGLIESRIDHLHRIGNEIFIVDTVLIKG